MRSHVTRTVSACFAVLRQLRSIRRSVPRSVFQSLVASLVLTRLDYGNSILAGILQYQLKRLVGDERCSPAGILFVAVRAHDPAASPIALAQSSGVHRLQACSPCVQVPSRSSTVVPRRRTQPAGQSESPFHHVVIAVRSAYAAVNYRRPGLSSRCSPCLELSAAARQVCTVSFHLPKPSEDSPVSE